MSFAGSATKSTPVIPGAAVDELMPVRLHDQRVLIGAAQVATTAGAAATSRLVRYGSNSPTAAASSDIPAASIVMRPSTRLRSVLRARGCAQAELPPTPGEVEGRAVRDSFAVAPGLLSDSRVTLARPTLTKSGDSSRS